MINTSEELIVYWQPGCTSCLKVKEYLTSRRVPFRSVNVLADPQGMDQLIKLGVRRVPILTKGDQWCDAQTLSDINQIAGIQPDGAQSLSADALAGKVHTILTILSQYVRQIPEDKLLVLLPNRPRSYGGLACHIAEIVDYFLRVVKHGHRLEFIDYDHPLPDELHNPERLHAYCDDVAQQFDAWRLRDLPKEDIHRSLDLYYGPQSVHAFLERSCWHAGQHLRQLELVLWQKIGVTPAVALTPGLFEGLPMPSAVWDDQLAF